MNKYFKVLFASVCFSLFFGLAVKAAPLSEVPVTLEQPDGTTVDGYASGDEYFSYITDENGSVIMLNEETGYYTFAKLEDGEMVPGDVVGNTQSGGAQQGGAASSYVTCETIPEAYIDSIRNENSILNSTVEEAEPTLFAMESESYNPSGYYNKTVHNLVIFIKFSNTNFTTKTISNYEEVFNTGSNSLKSYYDEVSYGRTQIQSEFCPKTDSTIVTYTAPNTRSYYVNPGTDRKAKEYSLLKSAVEWAIEKNYIPDDVDLDADDDGDIDSITFIVSGNVDTKSNAILWPHQWDFHSISTDLDDAEEMPTFNGLKFYSFSVNMERLVLGSTYGNAYQTYAASLCHETFHMVFSGPDLYYGYRTPNTNNGAVGNWDIMCSSNGAHMDTYLKFRYGRWINIPEITESGRYTLNPITESENNCYFIRSPYSSNEYFVVEYRKKGEEGSFEYNIPDSGLIIYRIDDNCWGNYYSGDYDEGSSDEYKEEVYVYRQNPSTSKTSTDVDSAFLNNTSANVVLKFRKEGNIYKSNPVTNGSDAGITISNVSAAGDTISFDVTFTTETQYGFRDIRLAELVAEAAGKTPETLTQSDLESITSLSLPYQRWYKLPYDLTGLEGCVNLTSFTADSKGITDITPLASLTKLTYLSLKGNNIKDISALSGLTELKTLKLRGNLITDYTPTQSYYSSLTSKDFSLTGNDVILRTSAYNNTTAVPTITADLTDTIPSDIWVNYELIDAAGKVTDHNLDYRTISGTEENIKLPSGFDCSEGKAIRLEVYERSDYRQMLYSIFIKPSTFDFSSINLGG